MSSEKSSELPLQGAPDTDCQEGKDNVPSTSEKAIVYAGSLIKQYLLDNVPEFCQLSDIRNQASFSTAQPPGYVVGDKADRQKGWKRREGDHYFEEQRHNADRADKKMKRIFYSMMQEIGQEMNNSTRALEIPKLGLNHPTILDLCMAPGGFLATTLKMNPEAGALAFSLPSSQGGHWVLLPKQSNVITKYLDITMLAADLGITDIPADHIEADRLLPQQIRSGQLFELILCDGQVLRNHARPEGRERREALRLTVTQLALGLEHVNVGGTLVILLHKVEAPNTVSLLYTFNKFSTVRLFKPTKHHAKRSSFYMIATNIQSQHPEAVQAVHRWKMLWKAATFGTDLEWAEERCNYRLDAEEVLCNFGTDLVRLGRGIWEIQTRALQKAPFNRKKPNAASNSQAV